MPRPPEDEIHELIDKCSEIADGEDGSNYPGMSYEEGIRDALNWVLTGEENPLEDV